MASHLYPHLNIDLLTEKIIIMCRIIIPSIESWRICFYSFQDCRGNHGARYYSDTNGGRNAKRCDDACCRNRDDDAPAAAKLPRVSGWQWPDIQRRTHAKSRSKRCNTTCVVVCRFCMKFWPHFFSKGTSQNGENSKYNGKY